VTQGVNHRGVLDAGVAISPTPPPSGVGVSPPRGRLRQRVWCRGGCPAAVLNRHATVGAMWVKRTEAELAEERKRQRRDHKRDAVLSGFVVLVFVTFVSGWLETYRRGRFIFPAPEPLSRLPFAIVIAVIFGFLMYKFKWDREQPLVNCPECETSKHEDGVDDCACGGHFEKYETMKYVAQSERSDEQPPSS